MYSNEDIFNYDKRSFDPSGPGPASYYVPRRPLQEKVAPSFTFGKRCLVEKSKFFEFFFSKIIKNNVFVNRRWWTHIMGKRVL